MARTTLDLADTFTDNSRKTWEGLLVAGKDATTDPQAIARALSKFTQTTLDGIDVQALYSRDVNTADFAPGSARRAAATPAPWDIRQIIRTSDPASGNQEILHELQNGATSVHLVPQQSASSSGIALRSAADLDTLLGGVYLDLISIGLEPADHVGEAIDWLFELTENRGVAAADVRVACNVDPFVTSTDADSHVITNAEEALVNLAKRCATTYPAVSVVAADTRQWHNLGASTVQELGIACATAVHHLKALLTGGMDLAAAQKQIVFHLAVDADFFTGIAKLRALRELWAHICQQFSSGVHKHATIHAHTSQRMLSRLDADNNQLRNTLACSAAAIGNADCISVEAHHSSQLKAYPLTQPDEFSRRVARNIQMILLEESNLHRVADPLGGSPFIESLTSELVAGAWQIFQQIEQQGGLAAAIQSGSLSRQIDDTQQRREQQLATRQSPIVGVSEFASFDQPRFAQANDQPALRRNSEPFEALRIASWQYEKHKGYKPAVLLLNLGASADYRGRAAFSRNFLATAGIATINSELVQPEIVDTAVVEKLQRELLSAGTCIVTICASDKHYAELGADFFAALRKAGATCMVLAGRRQALAQKDFCDDEIYLGCNALEKLTALQASLGIPGLTAASPNTATESKS